MKNKIQVQTITSRPRRLGWLVHAIVWIVLFCFPFFFGARDTDTISLHDYMRFFIMLTGTLVVFYVNYSYLIKRLLFNRQRLLFLLCNLLLFAVVILITNLLRDPLIMPEEIMVDNRRLHPPDNVYPFIILTDVVRFTVLTILCIALKATNSWYQMDTERKELEKQRSEAELQNLKNQLNPHFLFNTLNNIYSLIAINGEQAQEAVLDLSRLLRYMLYDSAQEFVTLEKDIDFVRNYVELMRIRMPEHVDLKTTFHVEHPELSIAPLLFISPVENAFKHGISNSKPSFVHIEIIAEGKQIRCSIRNSYFPKDKQDKSGSGIGLLNLQKRLDLLYPDRHVLNCQQSDDMYSCELVIKIE